MKMLAIDSVDKLFSEAVQSWDLVRLYADLEEISGKELKAAEKACLRGLLCRYRPGQIAFKLNWTSGSLRVELNKGLYRYIEALAQQPPNTLRWERINEWMETSGYKVSHSERGQVTSSRSIDWGEAPEIPIFFGRRDQLQTLEQWIIHDRCRLIVIWGMGGLGKTALTVKLIEKIHNQFALTVWRSLRHVLPFSQLMEEWVQRLGCLGNTPIDRTNFWETVRSYRTLLILDDFETILQDGELAGSYRQGCAGYGALLRQLGTERHQSCVVILSREQPKEILLLQGEEIPVRSLKLKGLERQDARSLLNSRGFQGKEAGIDDLIQQYRGNPAALKIVSVTIQELFNGNVSEFLSHTALALGDILRNLLYEQFERISELEKDILYWLALKRRPIDLAELRRDMGMMASGSEMIEALESLCWRSLIDKSLDGQDVLFLLEPVVMKYVNQKLIDEVTKEITLIVQTKSFAASFFLKHYPLVEDQAPDQIRAVQIRLMLKPVKDKLHAILRRAGVTIAELQKLIKHQVDEECLENNLTLLGIWFSVTDLPDG